MLQTEAPASHSNDEWNYTIWKSSFNDSISNHTSSFYFYPIMTFQFSNYQKKKNGKHFYMAKQLKFSEMKLKSSFEISADYLWFKNDSYKKRIENDFKWINFPAFFYAVWKFRETRNSISSLFYTTHRECRVMCWRFRVKTVYSDSANSSEGNSKWEKNLLKRQNRKLKKQKGLKLNNFSLSPSSSAFINKLRCELSELHESMFHLLQHHHLAVWNSSTLFFLTPWPIMTLFPFCWCCCFHGDSKKYV